MDEKTFLRHIQMLPPAQRPGAIIGKELYTLSRGYYARGEKLYELGFRSHLPIQVEFDEVFEVTPIERQEEMEETLFDVSATLCMGAFWNKYLDDEHARSAQERREVASATGNHWETSKTSLRKRLRRMSAQARSEFFRRQSRLLKSIRHHRESELARFLDELDSSELNQRSMSNPLRLTAERFQALGLQKGRSRSGILEFSRALCDRWDWVFFIDSQKLRLEKTTYSDGTVGPLGNLELFFRIRQRDETGKARLNLGHMGFNMTDLYPIDRFPVQDVFSSFWSAMELRFLIETKMTMFQLIADEMGSALMTGIKALEAGEG